MKKTVTVQIGNSDNKLSQLDWANFCNLVHSEIIISAREKFISLPHL